MKQTVLQTPPDLDWLRSVTLQGVPLPAQFASFNFAILRGNEDAPDYVDLFNPKVPLVDDDFLRVRFTDIAPLSYCEYVTYDGKSQLPKTGGPCKLARI